MIWEEWWRLVRPSKPSRARRAERLAGDGPVLAQPDENLHLRDQGSGSGGDSRCGRWALNRGTELAIRTRLWVVVMKAARARPACPQRPLHQRPDGDQGEVRCPRPAGGDALHSRRRSGAASGSAQPALSAPRGAQGGGDGPRHGPGTGPPESATAGSVTAGHRGRLTKRKGPTLRGGMWHPQLVARVLSTSRRLEKLRALPPRSTRAVLRRLAVASGRPTVTAVLRRAS